MARQDTEPGRLGLEVCMGRLDIGMKTLLLARFSGMIIITIPFDA